MSSKTKGRQDSADSRSALAQRIFFLCMLAALLLVLPVKAILRARTGGPRLPRPKVSAAALAALAESNNRFAFDLYAQVAAQSDDNIAFSPFSLYVLLALTHCAARGETADEIAKVAHLPSDRRVLDAGIAGMLDRLDAADRHRAFDVCAATRLWIQKGFPVRDSFLQTARKSYASDVSTVDFKNRTEQARMAINQWAREETKGRIAELVSRSQIDPGVVLALTNACYFKGAWAHKFQVSETKVLPFETLDGGKVNVPIMHQERSFQYVYSDVYSEADVEYRMLELPYRGEVLAMLLFLPARTEDFRRFEKDHFKCKILSTWYRCHYGRPDLPVWIPRFDFAHELDARGALSAMGIRRLFDSEQADLSGLSTAPGLHVKFMHQKSTVSVDEEGTVAAGATYEAMAAELFPMFRADHPFIYVILDKGTGMILFMGRVTDPAVS